MIDDIDIWRTAHVMLKRYGGDAVAESEKRAAELEAASDYHGAVTFRRIATAAAELSRLKPNGSDRIH